MHIISPKICPTCYQYWCVHKASKMITTTRVQNITYNSKYFDIRDCCICLQQLVVDKIGIISKSTVSDYELKQLKCGHLFHAYCINKWLKRNDKCPMCRAIHINNL